MLSHRKEVSNMKICVLNEYIYNIKRNSIFGHDIALNNILEMIAKYATLDVTYLCSDFESPGLEIGHDLYKDTQFKTMIVDNVSPIKIFDYILK